MTGFRIAAIPTNYRGRQYRSRLEAKWAAFFDLLRWRYEYEPYDLGSWSPDFLIHRSGGRHLLVEVKPVMEFDSAVAAKMVGACHARDLHEARAAVMLVGTSPLCVRDEPDGCRIMRHLRLGWITGLGDSLPLLDDHGEYTRVEWRRETNWQEARLGWEPFRQMPGVFPTILSDPGEDHYARDHAGRTVWEDWIGQDGDYRHAMFYPDYAESLWAEATNKVQWLGVGAEP